MFGFRVQDLFLHCSLSQNALANTSREKKFAIKHVHHQREDLFKFTWLTSKGYNITALERKDAQMMLCNMQCLLMDETYRYELHSTPCRRRDHMPLACRWYLKNRHTNRTVSLFFYHKMYIKNSSRAQWIQLKQKTIHTGGSGVSSSLNSDSSDACALVVPGLVLRVLLADL